MKPPICCKCNREMIPIARHNQCLDCGISLRPQRVRRFVVSLLLLLALPLIADAQLFRRRSVTYSQPAIISEVPAATDALDAANQARALKRLPPFLRCPDLTIAAKSAAQYRAARRISGHCPNDFIHVPDGAWASAAGCGANDKAFGFTSCCLYEGWTYAGAAWVEVDGRLWCHLFVR